MLNTRCTVYRNFQKYHLEICSHWQQYYPHVQPHFLCILMICCLEICVVRYAVLSSKTMPTCLDFYDVVWIRTVRTTPRFMCNKCSCTTTLEFVPHVGLLLLKIMPFSNFPPPSDLCKGFSLSLLSCSSPLKKLSLWNVNNELG